MKETDGNTIPHTIDQNPIHTNAADFLINKHAMTKLANFNIADIEGALFTNGIPYDKLHSNKKIKLASPLTKKQIATYYFLTGSGWTSLGCEAFFDYFMYLTGQIGAKAIFQYIFNVNPSVALVNSIAGVCAAMDFVANLTNVTPGRDARDILKLATADDILKQAEVAMKKMEIHLNEREKLLNCLKQCFENAENKYGKLWYKQPVLDTQSKKIEGSTKQSRFKSYIKQSPYILTMGTVIFLTFIAFVMGSLADWDSIHDMHITKDLDINTDVDLDVGTYVSEHSWLNILSGAFFILNGLVYYTLMQGKDSVDGAMRFIWKHSETSFGKLFKNKWWMATLPLIQLIQASLQRGFGFGLIGYRVGDENVISPALRLYKWYLAIISAIGGGLQTFSSRYETFFSPYQDALMHKTQTTNETKPLLGENSIQQPGNHTTHQVVPRNCTDWNIIWKFLYNRDRCMIMLKASPATLTRGYFSYRLLNTLPLPVYYRLLIAIVVGVTIATHNFIIDSIHQLNVAFKNKEDPPLKDDTNRIAKGAGFVVNFGSNFSRLLMTVASFFVLLSPVVGPECAALIGLWLSLEYLIVNMPYFASKMGPRIEEIGQGLWNKCCCCKRTSGDTVAFDFQNGL